MIYQVMDNLSGEVFQVKEEETIFAGLRRTGRGPFRYGCEGGGCGVCKIRIESGEYAAVKKMSRQHVSLEEEAQGIVLACCVQPRRDLSFSKL